MITMPAYRLGAEELVELGSARKIQNAGRQPFFANRPRMSGALRMGDVAGAGAFLNERLTLDLGTLAALVDVPLSALSQGSDITWNSVADLLENVPTIGGLLAEITVLGDVAVKFSASVPGLTAQGLGNILGGIAKALSAQGATADNAKRNEAAKDNLVNGAPAGKQDAVRGVLDSMTVAGVDLGPVTSLDSRKAQGLSGVQKALLVGVPVLGMAAAVFMAR